MYEILAILITPLKLIVMAIIATFARMFHDQEKLTPRGTFARILMSTFILWVAFTTFKDYFGLTEDLSIVFAGALAFAFREVFDLFLLVVTNPTKLKELISKK